MDKHFGSDKTLKKLFNRNNIKVSYSCGKNVKQEIQNNNKKVIQQQRMKDSLPEQEERVCSCPKNKTCPLNGECLKKNIIYKATVSSEGEKDMVYFGQTMTTFKARMSNHLTSFRKAYKRRHCSLATHIWDLKLQSKEWTIEWEKVKECKLYSRESKKCDLCDSEKQEILKRMIEDSSTLLNTKNEFMSPCTHMYTELLSNQDPVTLPQDSNSVDLLQQSEDTTSVTEAPEDSLQVNHDLLHQQGGTSDVSEDLGDCLQLNHAPLHQLEDTRDVPEGAEDRVQLIHDPFHQSGGTNDGSGVPVHQLEAQEDQDGFITQLAQDIENQHLHDFGSLMLTRSQKTRLVMRRLQETRSPFDPG